MTDIVERLRSAADPANERGALFLEAADEILRLRVLLGAAALTPESKTFRELKDKIMSGMAKDLGVDHG